MYVKSVKKLFYASQIEFMLFRYDSALSGLFGRIVIMEQLLQMTKSIVVNGCQVWCV